MLKRINKIVAKILLVNLVVAMPLLAIENEPLPSWADGKTKSSIINFVTKVVTPNSPDFVPQQKRVATFDNDGTLWPEKPLYFQLMFALERLKKLAPAHPEWREKEPFSSILKGDLSGGEKSLYHLIMATHTGMTNEEFNGIVQAWIKKAKHPQRKKPYTELVYQPMLELLDYLKENDFTTYIVSGGDTQFMRAWSEEIYGIPPKQVIGSELAIEYEVKNNKAVLVRQPKFQILNNGKSKAISIDEHIGQRPLIAFGNSDGDLEMLQYTTLGKSNSLAILLHHTDSEREWAYDRKSKVGTLNKALDASKEHGWLVVDMKNDWLKVHP